MKNALLITLVILIASFMYGCNKQDEQVTEYGSVEAIEQSQEEENNEKNIFIPKEESLGYNYKPYKNGKMQLSFPYPASWDIKAISDNHIKLSSSNDARLPNTTIHIVADIDSLYTGTTANEIYNLFSTCVTDLDFSVDGCSYTKQLYDSPDVFTSLEEIIPNEPDTLLLTEDTDMQATNHLELRDSSVPLTNRCYYIHWQGIPILVFCVSKTEDKDSLTQLADYMVSNIKYYSEPLATTKTYMVTPIEDDFETTFAIPTLFVKSKANTMSTFDKIAHYEVPKSLGSAYSGITVNLYSGTRDAIPEMTEDYMQDYTVRELIFNAFEEPLKSSDLNNFHTVRKIGEGTFAGKDAMTFTSSIDIRKTFSNNYNTITDNSEIIEAYILMYDEGTINLLQLSSSKAQSEQCGEVLKLIEASLTTK